MKINGNEIKSGNILKHKDTLWSVNKVSHVKPGKGGAFAQVEMKNVFNGSKLNERFRSSETVEKIRLDQKDYQFLYQESDSLNFMDVDSYEQITLQKDFVGEERCLFLTEGIAVKIELYEEKPIALTLPEQMEFIVAETEPTIKGQTVTSSYKPALLENNVKVMVPPFINVGDRILVNPSLVEYIKRVD